MPRKIAKLTTTALSQVCGLVTDGTHDTPEIIESGYPLIKAKEIVGGNIDFENCNYISEDDHKKVISRSNPEKGDILFAHIGASLGETAFVRTNNEFSIKNIALFKPNIKKVSKHYLYYIVTSPVFQELVKIQKTGSAQPFLSLKQLRSFKFQYIDNLSIQKKIAAILSAYDELIENNNRRIAILEKMAEEIYREWFVRMRFPGHEKVKVVKGVPEGWGVVKVKNIVDRKRFGRIYREDELFESGKVIVIDQSVKDYLGYYDGEPEHIASIADPIILFGDHSCKMLLMIEPFSLAENVIPFQSKGNIPIVFLFYLIHNLIETTEYKRHWTELVNKPVFLPDPTLQNMYSDKTKNLLLEKDKLTKANYTLKQSRDLLLPRLISGKLDVENLDIVVPPEMSNTDPIEEKETEAA